MIGPAWLVGCGNMAGAMVAGWRTAGIDLRRTTAIRPSGTPVEGVRTVTDLPTGEAPHFIMLGIKPQKLNEVAPRLAPLVGPRTIFVSLLAGVSVATLRARFPDAGVIVRAMPNLPVAQRQGVIALYSEDEENHEWLGFVEALMAVLGFAPWCASESAFSAIGAVAGSGPAYVARFAEALAKGGERLGLDRELAWAIATQTLVGTAAMAPHETMADIARRVASPNGTTEQGLAVLDAAGGLQSLVDAMLGAAIARGRQLADEASARH